MSEDTNKKAAPRKKGGRKKKVAVTTLGCKVNQFESASFLSRFQDRGAIIVDFAEQADIYIVNTCAVTAKAGAQSRQSIRRALRSNPKARVIVTGCYAQIAPHDILEMVEQPLCIVGNGNKHNLVDIALTKKHCDLEMFMGDIARAKDICPLPVHGHKGRTRAHLKIQDGCNQFCSYCIVPYARGRSRSLTPAKVLEQLQVFVEEGFKEVVLTGIHIGTYGQDLDPVMQLYDLIHLLDQQGHPVRYRISSLEPTEISRDFLDLMVESATILPHLHIPLQSGDDVILKKMNRRYPVALFRKKVEDCLRLLPDLAIGVDVLVGFPGEDEQAFQNTVKLLTDLPVAYLHVFPYSMRPGTVAASMADQVENQIKEERVAILRELDNKKRIAFYKRHLGKTYRVLAESKNNRLGLMKGFTDNYIAVYFKAPQNMANEVLEVQLERIEDRHVVGRLLTTKKAEE